jgi:hypothetical protein
MIQQRLRGLSNKILSSLKVRARMTEDGYIGKNVVLWTTSPMLVQGPQGLWEPQVKGILDDFYPHHGNTSSIRKSARIG